MSDIPFNGTPRLRMICISRGLVLVATLCAALPTVAVELISNRFGGSVESRDPNGSSQLSGQGRNISTDGRYVAFLSAATNLVASPSLSKSLFQVYHYDRVEDRILRVSKGLDHPEFEAQFRDVAISGDGQWIAFASWALNPFVGEPRTEYELLLYDVQNDALSLLSRSTSGEPANGSSDHAVFSADGRYVAFESSATNLVVDDDNPTIDVFLLDRESRVVTLVSEANADVTETPSGRSRAPSISADGQVVAFESVVSLSVGDTDGKKDIYVYRTATSEVEWLTSSLDLIEERTARDPSISSDGRHVSLVTSLTSPFPNTAFDDAQVYRYDLLTGEILLVSASAAGEPAVGFPASGFAVEMGPPTISGDGERIAFASTSQSLDPAYDQAGSRLQQNVYLADETAATIARISPLPVRQRFLGELSSRPSISADGGTLLYTTFRQHTEEDNNGTDDVYMHSSALDSYDRIPAISHLNRAGRGRSSSDGAGSISYSGRYVVFSSFADNLTEVPTTNGKLNVFLKDTQTDVATLVSTFLDGAELPDNSLEPTISADGSVVVFITQGTGLTDDSGERSGEGTFDVYLYDVATKHTEVISKDIPLEDLQETDGLRAPRVSGDGSYVLFRAAPFNGLSTSPDDLAKIYVRDRPLNRLFEMEKAPIGITFRGPAIDADISADGTVVVVHRQYRQGDSDTKVGLFIYDLDSGEVRLELADTYFSNLRVSSDGRYVVFEGVKGVQGTSSLVSAGTVVVYDRLARISRKVSEDAVVSDSYNSASKPSISHDGRYITFEVTGVTSEDRFISDYGVEEIFIHDQLTGQTRPIRKVFDVPSQVSAAMPLTYKAGLSGDGGAVVFETINATIADADANNMSDVLLTRRSLERRELVSSVLPSSRSAVVDSPVGVFATVIALNDEAQCRIGLVTDADIAFNYQATDSLTNAPVGAPNPLLDLVANQPQSYVFSLTAHEEVEPGELVFNYSCDGVAVAQPLVGVNSLLFGAAVTPSADMVALAATLTNDGVVDVPTDGSFGFFSVASVNVGELSTITVTSAVTGFTVDEVVVCETDPGTGACLSPPTAEVVTEVVTGATPTFSVFLRNIGGVVFAPADNRIAITFADAGGVVRGRTSVAVR